MIILEREPNLDDMVVRVEVTEKAFVEDMRYLR